MVNGMIRPIRELILECLPMGNHEQDEYNFYDEGKIKVLTSRQVDCCLLLARLLHTLHQAKGIAGESGKRGQWAIQESVIEPGTTVAMELNPAFMRAVGHMAHGVYMELRDEGLKDVGLSIVEESYYSHNRLK